nr:hypothetical protein [Lachnospiraceae bacterium]
MREVEFKMERDGLIKVGDVLPVTEGKLPNSYYYILGRSFAMSGNFPITDRLKSKEAKVLDIKETPRGYYVVAQLDE